MRKAKIICTMGAACREEPVLSRLVEAGMDVARLNFSHGTHEDHLRAIGNVRKAADNAGRPVALLLDLQGPKIRVGKLEGGKAQLEAGAEVTITVDPAVLGNAQRFSCSYQGLPDDVSIGDPVLINDGAIKLEVIAVEGKDVRCRIKVGGTISDHKGINLPGTPVSIPALTPKDIEDLKFGLEHEVDYVALSFVRSADDLRLIKRYAPTTPIIAKLEKPQAVDRVDEIAQLAEGGMIARGDLGVEMPLERVPLIQKTAIERTNHYGKIAIVATQMLERMIVSPQPTRAAVSDVANGAPGAQAIRDHGRDDQHHRADAGGGRRGDARRGHRDRQRRTAEPAYVRGLDDADSPALKRLQLLPREFRLVAVLVRRLEQLAAGERRVVGRVHDEHAAHSTLPQLPLDAIPAGEHGSRRQLARHRRRLGRGKRRPPWSLRGAVRGSLRADEPVSRQIIRPGYQGGDDEPRGRGPNQRPPRPGRPIDVG